MALRKYRFHWKGTNQKPVDGVGTSPEDAFSKLGYGGGAAAALDYYEEITEIQLVGLPKFIEWEIEFWKSRESKHLRLGQAFLNQNFPEVSDSEVYYQEDPATARRLILSRYVAPFVE